MYLQPYFSFFFCFLSSSHWACWNLFIWFEDQTYQTGQGFCYLDGVNFLFEARLLRNNRPRILLVIFRRREFGSRGISWLMLSYVFLFLFFFPPFLHLLSTYFLLIQDKRNSQRWVMAVKNWYPCNLLLLLWLFLFLLLFCCCSSLFFTLAYRKRFLLLLTKVQKVLGILLELEWALVVPSMVSGVSVFRGQNMNMDMEKGV